MKRRNEEFNRLDRLYLKLVGYISLAGVLLIVLTYLWVHYEKILMGIFDFVDTWPTSPLLLLAICFVVLILLRIKKYK